MITAEYLQDDFLETGQGGGGSPLITRSQQRSARISSQAIPLEDTKFQNVLSGSVSSSRLHWTLPCKSSTSCWLKSTGRSSYELSLPVAAILDITEVSSFGSDATIICLSRGEWQNLNDAVMIWLTAVQRRRMINQMQPAQACRCSWEMSGRGQIGPVLWVDSGRTKSGSTRISIKYTRKLKSLSRFLLKVAPILPHVHPSQALSTMAPTRGRVKLDSGW